MLDEPKPESDSADDFEAREMLDGSPVVHRDKRVSRGMAGFMLLPSLLTLALSVVIPMQNATASKPVPPEVLPFVVAGLVLMSLLFVGLAIAFGVLRTLVTRRAVHVKYGLWGPTIELDRVRAARVKPYSLVKYGGWGIRRGLDGSWAYVAAGTGDVVEIEYVDERGREKKVVVGPQDPQALVRAIERERQKPRVRIEEFEPPRSARNSGDAELEAQAEDEIEQDRERKGRTLP